jgi:hypothetical protein
VIWTGNIDCMVEKSLRLKHLIKVRSFLPQFLMENNNCKKAGDNQPTAHQSREPSGPERKHFTRGLGEFFLCNQLVQLLLQGELAVKKLVLRLCLFLARGDFQSSHDKKASNEPG